MGGEGPILGTGGVKPMNIAGRVVREGERLHGMTAEERAWRKKWLKDQVLKPNEPQYILASRKELLNPIRRFYRYPLDFFFFKLVQPVTSPLLAQVLRFYTGRSLMGLWGMFAIFYYFKYNTNDWTGKGRWRVIAAKQKVYPGDPGYGVPLEEKQPHEYHDRGFSRSIFAKNFPQYSNQC